MAFLRELQEPSTTYDVFLSFRGKDTRLSFVDHLYQALINRNICTFFDEEEVETGEDLKPELAKAIKDSRASIIVLSENYASSTWCLDELVMILEQRRMNANYTVIPIFYHVKPIHLTKLQSSFGDALAQHKQKMEDENDEEKKLERAHKLELWKKGLEEVAKLKGMDANGRETVFIEEIVDEITGRLDLRLPNRIPHLIGMDLSICSISSWLKEHSSKTVDILTIWGMAGIGKTSLAKYIYNLHYHEFEICSFVEDIERRCAHQKSSLVDLHKQLLADILKKRMIKVRDVSMYITKIEKTLFRKKTLVILDGIDNFEQLDALIGTKVFRAGSKIIITTKDGSLTEKCSLFRTRFPPRHTMHALDCLSDTESLRLICWHAFGDNGPKKGYEEVVTKVTRYCGGHPLALKVLGSSLINEDVATWNDVFEMVNANNEFYSDVYKILQISFDSLPSENCKELFKHIACFFVGKDRQVTAIILKECGIRTSYGMQKLIDRRLITIGNKNELMMHQLLQEMGRKLVYQESPEKPWKRRRLWNHEESLGLLKEEKGTTKIQGLILDMKILGKQPFFGSSSVGELIKLTDGAVNQNYKAVPSIHKVYEFFLRIWSLIACLFLMFSSSHCKETKLRTKALCRMEKLNLLQLNHVNLNGSYKNFPRGLRWLCMHGFRLKYIPSEIPMENLVVLDMSYSDLKQLWKKPKLLISLKILNLSYCQLVRVSGFIGLPALERLILEGCANLIEVCESIGECNQLILLNMSYCNKLKKLPSSIGKLHKLRILSIDGCGACEPPIAIDDMESMEVLKADNINTQLHPFSLFISELVPRTPNPFLLSLPASLVTLSLKNNNLFNGSFPTDFNRLSMLKELYLDQNPIDSLPDFVKSFSRLEVLSVTRCFRLKSVLCLPRTIKRLSTVQCSSLVKITFHPEMSAPPLIDYDRSESLTEIKGIIKIQALKQIDKGILSSLGWKSLQYMKDNKVRIWDSYLCYCGKKIPIQMYYEFGIFSTCLPGIQFPNWLSQRNTGPSISFKMPSSPMNKRIHGLNVCFVRTFQGNIGSFSSFKAELRNVMIL